jgi:hypothetical protein
MLAGMSVCLHIRCLFCLVKFSSNLNILSEFFKNSYLAAVVFLHAGINTHTHTHIYIYIYIYIEGAKNLYTF